MAEDVDRDDESGPPPGFQREEVRGDEIAPDEAVELLFRDKLGRLDRWTLLNVVKALPRYVENGEQLLGLAAPMLEGQMGLLAVTDRQLIFLLQRSHPHEDLVVDRLVLRLASVESAEKPSAVDLEVVTADRTYAFRGKAKQMAEVAAIVAERAPGTMSGSDSA